MNGKPSKVTSMAWAAGLVVVISMGMGSFYTIDQGERGVVLEWGAVKEIAEPGLNFKWPFMNSVKTIDIKTHVTRLTLPSYSKDQQPANLGISVNWHAGDVKLVYSEYGDLDNLAQKIIGTNVPQSVKTIFGQFAAVTAIQQRDKLNVEIAEEVRKTIRGPIVIESIQLENIDFSEAYEHSVEQRMLAEVEVAKLRQNAEREKVQAQITVTQAQAEADSVRARAEADADAMKLKGEAEAAAIQAKGKALRENPELIELTKAERWNGELPTTMIPNTTVPFLDAGKANKE